MKQALIVIDVQNEYFEGGAMPVTYPANSFDNIKKAITSAKAHQIPVVYVKHLCPPEADCFRPDSFGQELHRATLITQAHCFSNVISTDSWISSL